MKEFDVIYDYVPGMENEGTQVLLREEGKFPYQYEYSYGRNKHDALLNLRDKVWDSIDEMEKVLGRLRQKEDAIEEALVELEGPPTL